MYPHGIDDISKAMGVTNPVIFKIVDDEIASGGGRYAAEFNSRTNRFTDEGRLRIEADLNALKQTQQ